MAAAIVEHEVNGERILVLNGAALVASKSAPGTWHATTSTTCDCLGFQYRGRCRHIAAVAEAAKPAFPICVKCHQPRQRLMARGMCSFCLSSLDD